MELQLARKFAVDKAFVKVYVYGKLP